MNDVQKFYDAVASNEGLKAKLTALDKELARKELSEAEADAFVKENVLLIAKEAGFNITLQDLESCVAMEGELSEDELTEAAGGLYICGLMSLFKDPAAECGCVSFGVGQA